MGTPKSLASVSPYTSDDCLTVGKREGGISRRFNISRSQSRLQMLNKRVREALEAISETFAPLSLIALWATSSWDCQISIGSCSTHPGFGYTCLNGLEARETRSPLLLNKMALELEVP